MNEIKLQSTCKRIQEIPWNETIYVSKIMFDPALFETHKARIDKVFNNAPNEVKEQQLQNILLRDTLFNKAMEKIVLCYEFNLSDEDVNKYREILRQSINLNNNIPENEKETRINQIAEKLVQKELIFNDIATEYNITVDAQETLNVLKEYEKTTGNTVDDIKADKSKLTGAVSALLEEKITAFIINKFDKNFDELQKNIELDKQAREQAAAQSSNNTSTDNNNNNNQN